VSRESGSTRLTEKGSRRRTTGLSVAAAQALRDYTEKAGLSHGPLFRARLNARNRKLGEGRMSDPMLHCLSTRPSPGSLVPPLPNCMARNPATLMLIARWSERTS